MSRPRAFALGGNGTWAPFDVPDDPSFWAQFLPIPVMLGGHPFTVWADPDAPETPITVVIAREVPIGKCLITAGHERRYPPKVPEMYPYEVWQIASCFQGSGLLMATLPPDTGVGELRVAWLAVTGSELPPWEEGPDWGSLRFS